MVNTEAKRPAAGGPGKGRRLSREERRQQILDGAVVFFAERGFDASTHQLAEHLGVAQSLIYSYFKNKRFLVGEVYESVFMRRWQHAWEAILIDRERSLAQRLIDFYERYTAAIFDEKWMRIYLFAGLRGMDIGRLYIRFVEERIIDRIVYELREEYEMPTPEQVPLRSWERELVWVFHGGVFYHGVREKVHRVPAACSIAEVMSVSVPMFIAGAGKVMQERLT